MEMHFGVVEDTQDPLMSGRVRARWFGVHTDNSSELPTEDLPWSIVVQSTASAAVGGIGETPRLLKGSWVVGSFMDTAKQKPIIFGSIAGIPGSVANKSLADTNNIADIMANIPPTVPPANTTKANGEIVEQPYIGSLTASHIKKLSDSISADDHTNEFKRYYEDLSNAGTIDSYTIPEKASGIIYVAHFMGEQAAIDLVKGKDTQDANGKSASAHYKDGYAVIVGITTSELPTHDNLSIVATDKTSSQRYQDARKYDPGVSQQSQKKQGFQDPSGKYPLSDHQNESDVNRLAKGTKISKTIVGEKETRRIKSVPVANSSKTWEQSPIPYGAVYPYNQVTASEAGHVFEMDDTPGASRINLHHAAGTFYEVDDTGNSVERTAGIRTIVVEKDELVYIKGSGHVNLDGDLSLRIGGTCNIQILGSASLSIDGDFSTKITGNYNLEVGGTCNVKAGTLNLEGTDSFNLSSSSLLFKSPTIQSNPWTGDIMFGPHSQSPSPISVSPIADYSPNIKIPAPVSRREAIDFILEDSPDVTSVLYQNTATPTLQKLNNTPALIVIPVSGICGFTELSSNTQLSTNYRLSDLCGAHPFPFNVGQHGLSAEEIACNLKQLAINVIEPLRERYSHLGFKINSCHREAGSNISKSKKISQHELGQAVDISFSEVRGQSNDREQFYNLAAEIKDAVPFDQLLLEYRSSGSVWIHISFNTTNLRRQILTLNDDKVYGEGLYLLT